MWIIKIKPQRNVILCVCVCVCVCVCLSSGCGCIIHVNISIIMQQVRLAVTSNRADVLIEFLVDAAGHFTVEVV